METCYACLSEATSVEHVPPKCLFPERKDYPLEDLRKNLITVPSCDKHNSAKSRDDEFLMISLAGMLGNNSIGYAHSTTKIHRALKRSAYRLIERVFISNREHFLVDLGDNKFIRAIAGTPDLPRLQSSIDLMARGVYKHHFGTRFNGEVKSLMSFLIVQHNGRSNLQSFLLARARRDVRDLPRFGANETVFFYQMVEPDQFGLRLLNLCFYENIEIFCALLPDGGNMPVHLGIELMKRGMPVTFLLDGCEFPVEIDK